jgi:hypothetical protein
MIPSDAAAAAENKHYIHGAGWDTIGAGAFPVIHPRLDIAVLFRVPWNDANLPFSVEVDLRNADGASILPNPPGPMGGSITVGRPPHATPGNDLLVPMVFTMAGVQFPTPGDYVLVMRVDGREAKRFPLHLVSLAPQTGSPGPARPSPESSES